MLFDRQIYFVVSLFEYEYGLQDHSSEMLLPVRNVKTHEFSEAIKEASIEGLKERMEIQ